MEVSCENCGARYLFDEARIPEAGLSVKCSKCAHVFRASRAEQAPAVADTAQGQQGTQWVIRKANGDELQFRELSTLQRWIVERKVSRGDQISKAGTSWQNVGSIGELEPFFKAVEGAAVAADAQGGRGDVGVVDPSYEAGPFTAGSGAWNIGAAQHRAGPQPSFDANDPSTYPDTIVDPKLSHGEGVFGRPTQTLDPDDDGFEDLFPKRRSRGKWVVLLLLLALGGGLGALQYRDPARVRGWLTDLTDLLGVPEAAKRHAAVAYEALDRDTEASIAAASEHFDKALLLAPRYSEARAGLAEAALVRAESLADEATVLAEQVQKAPDGEKEALAKQARAQHTAAEQQLRRALELAKEALDEDGASAAANRVMADYYRLAGNATQMEPLLEVASRAAPGDPRIAYVRGAALAADPARVDDAAAQLSAALAKLPLMHRARYLLAGLHRRGDNPDAAVAALEEILADAPDHTRARAMLEQIKLPPPAPPPAPPPEPPSEPPSEPAQPGKAPPVTVASLLAQAERLREADQVERAVRLYERALDLDNSDPDVHTGLGWCYVDLDRLDAAIGSFKRALAVAPRFSDAHMGIAEAYRAKGMKRDAVKHYRKYLDVFPDGPDAAVARRMLQTMSQP